MLLLPIITGVPCLSKCSDNSRHTEFNVSPCRKDIMRHVTSKCAFNTKETSIEPIQSLEPTNDLFLSPISTKICCISRMEGTGLLVHPCHLLKHKKY